MIDKMNKQYPIGSNITVTITGEVTRHNNYKSSMEITDKQGDVHYVYIGPGNSSCVKTEVKHDFKLGQVYEVTSSASSDTGIWFVFEKNGRTNFFSMRNVEMSESEFLVFVRNRNLKLAFDPKKA